MDAIHTLLTETNNPATAGISGCSTLEMLRLINDEDKKVAPAVERELPHIADAVDRIAARLQAGGRLFYIGAGTSGRLAVVDASECRCTYGVPTDLVQAILAGGLEGIGDAAQGDEDDAAMGREESAAGGPGPATRSSASLRAGALPTCWARSRRRTRPGASPSVCAAIRIPRCPAWPPSPSPLSPGRKRSRVPPG